MPRRRWHRVPVVDRRRHRGSDCGTIRVVGRSVGSRRDGGGGGDDVDSNPCRGRRRLDRRRRPCPLCLPCPCPDRRRRRLRDGDCDRRPDGDAVDCDSPILCCSNCSNLLLLPWRSLSAADDVVVGVDVAVVFPYPYSSWEAEEEAEAAEG